MSKSWNLLTRRALHRASQVGVGLIARGFSPRGSAGAKYGVAAQACLARLPPLARNGAHSQKKRDARLFLPPGLCTRCDVVEESATHFAREATMPARTSAKSSPSSFRQRSPSSRQPAHARGPSSTSCSWMPPGNCNCGSIAILVCATRSQTGLKSKPNKLS